MEEGMCWEGIRIVMDDKEYEWRGYKKEMNEHNTPPNWKMIWRWKMGSGTDVDWRMINNAQNGFL